MLRPPKRPRPVHVRFIRVDTRLPVWSARIGADHLGHSRISTTQDKYMARGRVHTAVADMLDRAINDE
jgi:hypothetical protein